MISQGGIAASDVNTRTGSLTLENAVDGDTSGMSLGYVHIGWRSPSILITTVIITVLYDADHFRLQVILDCLLTLPRRPLFRKRPTSAETRHARGTFRDIEHGIIIIIILLAIVVVVQSNNDRFFLRVAPLMIIYYRYRPLTLHSQHDGTPHPFVIIRLTRTHHESLLRLYALSVSLSLSRCLIPSCKTGEKKLSKDDSYL